jgi:hypothetical protein
MRHQAYTRSCHYRNPGLCRVPTALSSAFCRALGKDFFTESRTRQSPTPGNEVVYQVQDTRYRNTLGKDVFAECRTLGKGSSRQRAVSDRLKLTTVVSVSTPGVPGPTSEIVTVCPSPDWLARDGTQGGKNAARVILRQGGCACSRGYKHSRGRGSEPVRQLILPRDHPLV